MANKGMAGATCGWKRLIVLLLAFSGAAHAQLNVTIQNISPQQANPEGGNSNRASGGRVNKLGVDPASSDVYYAASEWGGLFKTVDRGLTWRSLDGFVPQATWDVAVSPLDSNRAIATSFFDGKTTPLSGISLSTDGGDTWTNPATGRPDAADCISTARFESPTAYGIAFDSADANNVLVRTNCGLASSADGGNTWDYIDPTPASPGGTDVWAVLIHNGGIVDICGSEGHFRRAAGATNWTAGTGEAGGICSLAVSPDEPNVLFMTVGTTIFDSTDGGANWNTTYAPLATQGRIPFIRTNNRNGAAYDIWYGDTQLFSGTCTTPADTTSTAARCTLTTAWTNRQTGAHWDVGDLAFDPTAADDACPVLFSNDGGVYRNADTSDPGCHAASWEQPDVTPSALWLFDMEGATRADDFEAEGVYMGQQDTGAFGAEDGARQPRPDWNTPQCCDIFDVEAEATRTVFIDGFWGGTTPWRIQLDGTNFDGSNGQIATYPPGNIFSFQEMESLVNYAANSYAIVTWGASGGIFFTTNIGASPVTWQQLGTNPPAACAIRATQQADGTPVFTAKVGGCNSDGTGALWQLVGATTTGTWTQITRNGSSQFTIFAVDPNDEDHIIAADRSAGGDVIEMVRTTDGGTNWTNLTGLDALMTGSGQFLLRPSFSPVRFGTGSNYFQPSLVAISPDDSDVIVAGGQDSGVFLSTDGGTNWVLLSDPLGLDPARPHVSRPLYAHFEAVETGRFNLYVGTRGKGVWRITVDEAARDPIDVALVLDTSGSMNSPACPTCEDKIDVLRDAAEIFIETWRVFSDEDDRAAVVYFDSSISNFDDGGDDLVVLGASFADLIADIRSENAGGGTSMGGGLQRAIDILELDASRSRSIVLFTDGMQNINPEVNTQADGDLEISNSPGTPNSNVSPDSPPVELTSALDIEVNTIGVGSTGSFTTLLADIANDTDAETYVTTAPDQDLRRFFVEELVDTLRDGSPQLIDYRYATLDHRGRDTQAFSVTSTAKAVVFKLSWRDDRSFESVSILKDGVDVTRLASVRRGSFYRILSFTTAANTGLSSGGTWELRTFGRPGMAYELAAIADELSLDYELSVGQRTIAAGESIELGATILYDGSPVDGATVTARVLRPQTSIQTLLSSRRFAGTAAGPAPEPNATIGQRRLASLHANESAFAQALSTATSTVTLPPVGPGQYAARSALTRTEGAYGIVFTIDVVANGERFIRTERESVIVAPGPFLPNDTNFVVNVTDTGSRFVTELVMTPVDRFENYLGPDRNDEIDVFVLDAGASVENIVDRGDGTYVITLRSPNENPTVRILVRDDEVASGPVNALDTGTSARDGYYLTLLGGASVFRDDSSSLPAFVGAPGNATSFDAQWGLAIGAAIGKHIATTSAGNLRLEFEAALRESDIDSAAGLYPGGERRLGTLMVNAAFDFNPSAGWSPYLGGGVGLGFARAEQDVFDNSTVPVTTVGFKDSETTFAWQVFGGVSRVVGSNIDAFLQGRYVDGGDLDLAPDFGKIDFEAFAIEAGIRIRF